MHHATAIVAILQISVTVIGFFALGIILKLFGYPGATVLEWNPMAVFLREYGLVFLAFPLVWCIYAVSADNLDNRWLSPTIAAILGIAFIFVIGGLFLVAATYPYTHRHVPYSSTNRIRSMPVVHIQVWHATSCLPGVIALKHKGSNKRFNPTCDA